MRALAVMLLLSSPASFAAPPAKNADTADAQWTIVGNRKSARPSLTTRDVSRYFAVMSVTPAA